jgi:hypothetical protein
MEVTISRKDPDLGSGGVVEVTSATWDLEGKKRGSGGS